MKACYPRLFEPIRWRPSFQEQDYRLRNRLFDTIGNREGGFSHPYAAAYYERLAIGEQQQLPSAVATLIRNMVILATFTFSRRSQFNSLLLSHCPFHHPPRCCCLR